MADPNAPDSGSSDFFTMLSGLKNPIGAIMGGGGDPTAMNPQYGVPNQQVANARRQSWGNVGALLLSAAQPQSMDQRAQTLGGLGNAANITPQLNAQQQMMMRNQQMQLISQQVQQNQIKTQSLQRMQQLAQTPQFQQALIDLPPGQRMAATIALQSGDISGVVSVINNSKLLDIQKEQAHAAIAASGAAAAHSKAETDKINYEMSMRKAFFGGSSPDVPGVGAPGTPGSVPPPGAVPGGGLPVAPAGAAPAQAPQPQAAAPGSPPSPFGSNPAGVFGPIGAITEPVRTVQGAVGMNITPTNTERELATQHIAQLNNDLLSDLRVDSSGRQTTWGLKKAEDLLPEPNTFGDAAPRAIAQYTAAQNEISLQLQRENDAYRAAGATGDMKGAMAARAKIVKLQQDGARVGQLLSGLQANQKGQLPPDNPLVQEMRKRGLLK